MDMLDRLYAKFDGIARKYDIFKVETIGDAYMAVANLVEAQPNHTERIAKFALEVAPIQQLPIVLPIVCGNIAHFILRALAT